MNLFELFVKIGVDDEASKKVNDLSNKFKKTLTTSIKVATTAVVAFGTAAIKSYANYEQLVGGVETLFKKSSNTIMKYAKTAYKTAGMSSSEYMSTATSFAASLINSFKDTSSEITEEMAEDMIASLDKQVDAFEEATDAQIKLINKQYTENMKLIDREEYERLKAVDDQIAAIEAEEAAEEAAIKKRQQEEEKARLQKLIDAAADSEARQKAEKKLADYVQELAEQERKQARKDQISALKDQKDAIKDEFDLKRDALKEQHDYELEAYKEARDKELAYLKEHLKKQEKEIKASIGTMTEAVSLPAEAYEKAAQATDMAITDMADNANKMGTSIELIQNAYQGFSKQNYTMLDNLKLGYGGTKTEMERLIADANRVKEANGEMGDLTITKFADVVEAIHIIQSEMGITGATAQEAEHTISGSAASMKAAFDNFMVAMVDDNADVGESFDELKSTVGTFLDNITPKIWDFVDSLGPIAPVLAGITAALGAFKTAAAISKVIGAATAAFQAYKTANEGATVAQWLMNAAMNANPIVLIVTLIAGLVAALVTLWHTNDDFKNALIGAWDAIKNAAVVVWEGIVKFFTEDIPNAFNAVINFVKDNWQSLLLFITNPIAGALKLLYDLNPKFREWVDNVWKSIKNGFNKIIDGAKTWGKDLLDNFIGGIKAKIQKLKDMVSNVAQTVKDFLGFSEPKKGPLSNFHTYAPDMMDLFAKGIRDNEDVITDQIDKSFDFGERTMKFGSEYGSGAAGGAFGGTTFNGDIIINVNGDKHHDENALAEALALKLQGMTDRRAAVYA